MTMFCLIPVLMMGYMTGFEVGVGDYHHRYRETPSGEIIELHSCLKGPSLVATLAPSSGLWGTGLEWSFPFDLGPVTVTLTPQVGLSYDTHGYYELPMGTQFEVGGMVSATYGRASIGLKYWHMSNAHLKAPNIGMDIVALMGGFTF